jgi:hypothetical protein
VSLFPLSLSLSLFFALTNLFPPSLLTVRAKLYELLAHCIPPEMILKTLTLELLRKLDAQIKNEVIEAAAFYVRHTEKRERKREKRERERETKERGDR